MRIIKIYLTTMTLLFALKGIILFPANIHNAINKFLTFQLIFPFSTLIFVNFIIFTLSKHKHLRILSPDTCVLI